MRKLLTTLFLLSLPFLSIAQMLMGTDTLYGNEWIQFDQSYFKIPITEDGLYRMTRAEMESAGIPMNAVEGNQLRLYYLGEEIPVYISNSGNLSDNDYLLFWGKQNRGELDQYLFEDPEEEQLNPFYSLVTDTSHYFLTWNTTAASSRYQTIDLDLSQAPVREEWVWRTERQVFSEKFMKNYARRSGITIYFSNYDVAEGYGNRNINELLASGATTQDFTIDLPKAFTNGPQARLEARFGVGSGDHQQVVKVDGNTYFDRSYSGVAVKTPSFNFPLTDDRVEVTFEGLTDDRDEQSIAYLQIQYPSSADAASQSVFSFEVDGGNDQKYLEISGFNSNNGTPVLYDLTHHLRILCQYENGIVKALLPAHDAQRSLVLLEEDPTASPVPSIIPHAFTDLLAQPADYLLLTAPLLRTPYESEDQVQAYADYRQSPAGGSYTPKIVEIQNIYDQFGYGLHRHPQSIRNFVHAAHRRWPNLKYVFLIGKGREYTALRSAQGLKDAIDAETYFVPSFGFPASDNLLLSNNSSSVAVVPVGRIAAISPKEISIYLNKVKNLEATVSNGQTIEERAWMKNIIHLGGGGSSGEQVAIKNNLERMAGEIEGNLFGGRVTPFYKTSTDPIQQSRSEQIFDRINEGTAVITFFGHSSPGTFDFNIDNPDNYENFGKFPLILSLGCYSGNFFTSSRGIGERFTFYEDKASVAFGASRGVGFISTLGGFADRFYEKMGGEKYGAGIGDIVSATRRSLDHLTGLEIKTVVQQFSMMGDPAIRLHPSPGPDYVVDRSSVSFSPKVISIQEDSFQLQFDVLNLGQFIQDSITVVIRQKRPNSEEDKVKSLRIATPAYSSTHQVNLSTVGKSAIGLNTFFIEVDANDEIDELPAPAGEINNALVRSDGQPGVTLFIVDNTARPVYPQKFALVGEAPVTLKASTSDALAPERKYLLEIDTTHLFDSPLRERTEIIQRGGVIKWTPTLPLKDSTVYYWRISPDSTEAEIGYVWEASSFTYIEGIGHGWGQGHWGQWLEGEGEGIEVSTATRTFKYIEERINVKIRNKIYDIEDRPGLVYNNENIAGSVQPWRYLDHGLAVVVNNPFTAGFWRNQSGQGPFEPGEYGVLTDNSRVFAFPTSSIEERENLLTFLEDVIPDDYYVFVFSILDTDQADLETEEWEADSLSRERNIFSVLESEGARLIRKFIDRKAVPYIFMYQKGNGALAENIGTDIYSDLFEDIDIPRFLTEGTYFSPAIGPVTEWGKLTWEGEASNNPSDNSYLKVFGSSPNQEDSLLIDNIVESEIDLSLLDPIKYPFIRLAYYAKDEVDRSPLQLYHWHVLYKGVPEAAVNPSKLFSIEKDTIQEGESINLQVAFENISLFDMDSLLVRYSIRDKFNNESEKRLRISPLLADKEINFELPLLIEGVDGNVNLTLEINPFNDQAELFHFNNNLNWDFFIASDRKPPVLDVTFDGVRIMEGDIISPEPTIQITLKDENLYLPLVDTSLIEISLMNPDGTIDRFSSSDENFSFISNFSDRTNEAIVQLRPNFKLDGTYELTVQAKDETGNLSGAFPYKVNFEVITKNMVANVLNYPNPFSSSTQFVYTLTGRVPTYFTIQIMTVSGRLIKEIDLAGLGELKIGTHRTEYHWDGTDEYGDILANGVYLYRVNVKDESGADYEHYDGSVDELFKKGWGKLVILR